MEHVSIYRRVVRVIKGGAKELEVANRQIQLASIDVDYHRTRVRNRIQELRDMIPNVKIGGYREE